VVDWRLSRRKTDYRLCPLPLASPNC